MGFKGSRGEFRKEGKEGKFETIPLHNVQVACELQF